MLSPYGLDIIESCLTCKVRADRIFCDLPAAALQCFEGIKYATAYPKGAVLFVEGQAPRGIFVLCKGRVKLSICASDGKTLIVKIAEPGEVLGLSASVSGKAYELTAETLDPCQVNFIESNPIPLKAAMAAMGLLEEHYRLPLVPPSAAARDKTMRVLQNLKMLGAAARV